MAVFQPSSADGSSISPNTRSIMPSRRSSLLEMWLYSDIASTPTASPSLRIESVSIPFSSAKAAAARRTRSRLRGMRGAGTGTGRRGHSGLLFCAAVGGVVVRNRLTYLQCTCSLHRKHTSYAVPARPSPGSAARHPRKGDPDDEPRCGTSCPAPRPGSGCEPAGTEGQPHRRGGAAAHVCPGRLRLQRRDPRAHHARECRPDSPGHPGAPGIVPVRHRLPVPGHRA